MNGDKGSGASVAKAPEADQMRNLRLKAARKRLAESRDQADALEGLREIVTNLLGCEEIGLFRVDRQTTTFPIFWSFGIDPDQYDLLCALGEAGLQQILRGECHIAMPTRDPLGRICKAQAFVPILSASQTVAILAILRLLPQKIAFDKSDLELFKLLSEEAAGPLFGSDNNSKLVHQKSGTGA